MDVIFHLDLYFELVQRRMRASFLHHYDNYCNLIFYLYLIFDILVRAFTNMRACVRV